VLNECHRSNRKEESEEEKGLKGTGRNNRRQVSHKFLYHCYIKTVCNYFIYATIIFYIILDIMFEKLYRMIKKY